MLIKNGAESGIKFSLNAFKSQIKKIGIAEPINIRCFGKQSKCYVLNIDTLRNNFREFLKNPTFDFDIIQGDRDDE